MTWRGAPPSLFDSNAAHLLASRASRVSPPGLGHPSRTSACDAGSHPSSQRWSLGTPARSVAAHCPSRRSSADLSRELCQRLLPDSSCLNGQCHQTVTSRLVWRWTWYGGCRWFRHLTPPRDCPLRHLYPWNYQWWSFDWLLWLSVAQADCSSHSWTSCRASLQTRSPTWSESSFGLAIRKLQLFAAWRTRWSKTLSRRRHPSVTGSNSVQISYRLIRNSKSHQSSAC